MSSGIFVSRLLRQEWEEWVCYSIFVISRHTHRIYVFKSNAIVIYCARVSPSTLVLRIPLSEIPNDYFIRDVCRALYEPETWRASERY
jgi:hypothetical protein